MCRRVTRFRVAAAAVLALSTVVLAGCSTPDSSNRPAATGLTDEAAAPTQSESVAPTAVASASPARSDSSASPDNAARPDPCLWDVADVNRELAWSEIDMVTSRPSEDECEYDHSNEAEMFDLPVYGLDVARRSYEVRRYDDDPTSRSSGYAGSCEYFKEREQRGETHGLATVCEQTPAADIVVSTTGGWIYFDTCYFFVMGTGDIDARYSASILQLLRQAAHNVTC